MVYIASNNHKTASRKRDTALALGNTLPNSQVEFVLRRMRINRILMYKRRIECTGSSVLRKALIILTVLSTVVIILTSGTVGGAYAYYQAQLPLLDGIAQHSLFQTTHIYDRNGKLLYELYDKQEGRGRRTYINYQDISPWLINATVSAEDHTFWSNTI